MAFDPKSITESQDTTRLTVKSNTQISSRATAVISKLFAATTTTQSEENNNSKTPKPAKPALVVLQAQSRWASKLISIVEIAKRDLQAKSIPVYQYTALSSEIIEVGRLPKADAGATDATEDEHASEDEAFQTLGADKLPEMKKRAVPIITVYLTVQPVKALKTQYG